MDINNIFAQAGGTAGIIAVLGIIYKSVIHKRIRSNCCGYKTEMSIDVSDLPPSPTEVIVQNNNPMIQHNGGTATQVGSGNSVLPESNSKL
jgi:hypothetical protein